MKTKTLYVLDIYLVSGAVMHNVTVEEFSIRQKAGKRTMEWTSAGPDPLLWLRLEQVAGVVTRDEYEVPDMSQMGDDFDG